MRNETEEHKLEEDIWKQNVFLIRLYIWWLVSERITSLARISLFYSNCAASKRRFNGPTRDYAEKTWRQQRNLQQEEVCFGRK
jgi:hypothetical protein